MNLARQLRDKLVPFLQITRPEQHFERPDMICMGYLMRCRHKSMVIARIVNAATGGLETAALATVPETACTVENTKEDVLDKMMWAETALNAATEAAKKLEADLAQLPASDTPGKTPTIRINKLTSRSNNDYFGFEDAVLNGVLAQIGQHRSEKYRILDPFASEVDVSNQPGGESASDLNKMLDTIRTSLAPADYYLKISVQVQQKGHQIDPVTGERSKVKDTATVDLSLSRRKDGRIFGVKNGTAILTNY